jgi:hypothetical protein
MDWTTWQKVVFFSISDTDGFQIFPFLQQSYYSNIKPESTDSSLLNWIIFVLVTDKIQFITHLSKEDTDRGIDLLLYNVNISKAMPFMETGDNQFGTKYRGLQISTMTSNKEVAWRANASEQTSDTGNWRKDRAIHKKFRDQLS